MAIQISALGQQHCIACLKPFAAKPTRFRELERIMALPGIPGTELPETPISPAAALGVIR